MVMANWKVLLRILVFLVTAAPRRAAPHHDLRPFHIVLNACNTTGRLPPRSVDCEALRSANPEVMFSSDLPQSFAVPRTGNYTITVAGAQGGKGACSRTAGRGVKVQVTHVFLRKDNSIILFIGQKGTSACDTNPTHPVCQLDESAEDFEGQCLEVLRNTTPAEWQLVDGGGGGGGRTILAHLNEAFVTRFSIVAGGGGGAAAIPSKIALRPDGHYSPSPGKFSNGVHIGNATVSAGAGGGGGIINALVGQSPVDGNQPSHSGIFSLGGGTDCLSNASTSFPETVGGFGGGGGGCGNGGGGGGWVGGDVVAGGNIFPGKGGTTLISTSMMETTLSFHEDGNGFAEFFFESCSCTFECVPNFEEQLFSCLCPNGTQLAQDGLDCLRDEVFPIVSEQSNSVNRDRLVINSDLYELDETVFVYSMSVEFQAKAESAVLRSEPDPLSMSCIALLIFEGMAVVASEIVRVDHFGSNRTTEKIVPLNGTSSGNYTLMIDQPVEVSGVEIIGVDVVCEATVTWNVSTRRGREQPTDTALVNIDNTLLAVSSACNRSTACATLVQFPPERGSEAPPLSVAAVALGIIIPSLGLSFLLAIMVGLIYWKHKKGKLHISTGYTAVDVPGSVSLLHYQLLSPSSDTPPAELHSPRTGAEFRVEYVRQQDVAYSNLRQLLPRHGVADKHLAFTSITQWKEAQKKDPQGWLYSRWELEFVKKLGGGQFGEVLLMIACSEICGTSNVPVAVKTLQSDRSEDEEAFFREIDLMKTFHHPNIVSFLGFCEESTGDLAAPPLMVLEYMALGDLLNLLIANRPEPESECRLSQEDLGGFAVDVAKALHYLSGHSLVHRDVAARNVLVSQSLVAKLADFGLTRRLNENDYYKIQHQGVLPVRWMAPESIHYGQFTTQSDVWSYGVLLWEIATFGQFPHSDKTLDVLTELAGNGQLQLDLPLECSVEFASAIADCQRHDPSARPTFWELANRFNPARKQSHCSTMPSIATNC